LTKAYAHTVNAEDVMAYLAAVLANPAFIKRFESDLVRPELRVPFTASSPLFWKAVEIGREIVWLHTFGERFVDPKAGRPASAPRLPKEAAPRIPASGAIPSEPEPLPDEISYEAPKRRLHVGKGYVDNVSPEVWAYEVSGKQVLRQWFSYRQRDRSRPVIGDRRPPSSLDKIQPEGWMAEYTDDLIDLLNVLGRIVALEPKQAELLEHICNEPILSEVLLRDAGALEAPQMVTRPKTKDEKQHDLL
jgi:hypothetical protein